jgi:hypothetical protein
MEMCLGIAIVPPVYIGLWSQGAPLEKNDDTNGYLSDVSNPGKGSYSILTPYRLGGLEGKNRPRMKKKMVVPNK